MRILAAFIFFTRLPFWRIHQIPTEHFKHVVPYWPLTGWLTGGIMVGVLWLSAQILPVSIAWLLAIISRLLVTGGLHEDGFADFLDGFGGGTNRERTLSIMKDSHIGTYGTIGLIGYFLLLLLLLWNLPLKLICIVAMCGNCWPKFCASQLINFLPYARNEETSKAKVVYNSMSWDELLISFIAGALPILFFLPLYLWIATLLPIFTFIILYRLMKKRIQGYTGDCCGAAFLLCELSFYLGVVILCYAYAKYGSIDFTIYL